jgi:hypothetical protein
MVFAMRLMPQQLSHPDRLIAAFFFLIQQEPTYASPRLFYNSIY